MTERFTREIFPVLTPIAVDPGQPFPLISSLSLSLAIRLRAQGDVLVDQIAFMRRCGFDSFAPEASLNPEAVARALSTYDQFYQKAADAAVPVWKLRHG